MSQFKVGDVCTGHGLVHLHQYNGMECTILSYRGYCEMLGRVSGVYITDHIYRVKWADGSFSNVAKRNLRKEPPKAKRKIDTVVSWSDCAWRPNHVQIPYPQVQP